MKFGLCIALLVLLASTNVFGEERKPSRIAKSREDERTDSDADIDRGKSNRVRVSVTADKTVIDTQRADPRTETRPVEVERTGKPTESVEVVHKETKPVVVDIEHQGTKPVVVDIERQETKPDLVETGRKDTRPDLVETGRKDTRPDLVETGRKDTKPDLVETGRTDTKPDLVDVVRKPEEHLEQAHLIGDDETKLRRPDVTVPISENVAVSENSVHISGNVVLVKYRPSVIDTVQYDLDGARLINGGRPLIQSRPFARDFLARRSSVTLYVSTTDTIDRKLSFANFPIKFDNNNFPLSFDVDVELPNQQRGLLERGDITLFFFVYVTNLDTRVDTYVPVGRSQILLQGTNRLVQKLDVYVKASGIEVSGLFRGRFGQHLIESGTAFQIFIVPEYSLALRYTDKFESIAQLTINNVPAMYPVPFSLMVNYQSLKPHTKYYAIAFIFENGIQRPINQEPIWVINEDNVLVTSQVIFNVIPSPFLLRGVVSRSMPGQFFLQPGSSLILRLHEIGSDSPDIIFKLPEILTFPQVFQINVSESSRFDASKGYDMRALIMDDKNEIYMASLQPMPLVDELSRLTIPVDDLLYYVQVHLHTSSNQLLSYIPGSSAQVFVTETPETPTKPIVAVRFDSVASDFRDFSLRIPATAIQRGRNYYLVMMVELNGMITHVSKILLISNNQPPPLLIQLPVLSLNLVRGVIFDIENRPAQWSSSSYASLYLLDDKTEDPNKAVVQEWKIHVENDFPVRFEVQLDFSRLHAGLVYRLQGAIENGRDVIEYKPAGSVIALNPLGGIMSEVRIPVTNVKTSQTVKGLIYINDVRGPLPEKSEIIVQLSSSPSLTHPRIIDEIRLKVEERELPVEFTMNLPLNKIDITSVYYFLVQYVVRDTVVIPVTQAFAFSPRNDATVVLTLSKTPQIPITGQVTSTGSPLLLPDDATLHLYITDNANETKPFIFSEVYIKASANSLYEFTMNIDSLVLQKKIPLYLRADILYQNAIILSIPRPALLQITPGGEWNINLVVDLPTLLVGQIISMSQYEAISGEFEVYIQILERGTTHILYTSRLRLEANFPQKFRIEIDNELFVRYPTLQARAIIKNCKEQILFEAGGFVDIHAGLNVKVDLPVVLTNPQKFRELHGNLNDIASLYAGVWRLSVTGTATGTATGTIIGADSSAITTLDTGFVRQK